MLIVHYGSSAPSPQSSSTSNVGSGLTNLNSNLLGSSTNPGLLNGGLGTGLGFNGLNSFGGFTDSL